MGARLLAGVLALLVILLVSSSAAAQARGGAGARSVVPDAFRPSRLLPLPLAPAQLGVAPGSFAAVERRSLHTRHPILQRMGGRMNLALIEERNGVDWQRVRLQLELPRVGDQRPGFFASLGSETYLGHAALTPPSIAARVPSFYELYYDRMNRPTPVTQAVAGFGMTTVGATADASATLSAAAALARFLFVAVRDR
jgi:hypothetical protein